MLTFMSGLTLVLAVAIFIVSFFSRSQRRRDYDSVHIELRKTDQLLAQIENSLSTGSQHQSSLLFKPALESHSPDFQEWFLSRSSQKARVFKKLGGGWKIVAVPKFFDEAVEAAVSGQRSPPKMRAKRAQESTWIEPLYPDTVH